MCSNVIDRDSIGGTQLTAVLLSGLWLLASLVLTCVSLLNKEIFTLKPNLLFIFDVQSIFWQISIFSHIQYLIYARYFKGRFRCLYKNIADIVFGRLLCVSLIYCGSLILVVPGNKFYLPMASASVAIIFASFNIILVSIIRQKLKSTRLEYSYPSLEPMVAIRSVQELEGITIRSKVSGCIPKSKSKERDRKEYDLLMQKLVGVTKISMPACILVVVATTPLLVFYSDGSFISGIIISTPWKISQLISGIFIALHIHQSQLAKDAITSGE